MNDVLGGHPPGCRDHRLSRRQTIGMMNPSNLLALLQNLRPTRPMNRTINSTPTHQSSIRRIDNGIHSFFGDIPDFYNNRPCQKRSQYVHKTSPNSLFSVYNKAPNY